jgi:hypothetical protein
MPAEKKKQSFCPCGRALKRSGKGLNFLFKFNFYMSSEKREETI